MDIPKFLCSHGDEEDYIDIEMSSSPNLICFSIRSPPHSREFEFQMCSFPLDKKTSPYSPADELFFKGKLLHLHLPPRLHMLSKLLQNPNTTNSFHQSFQLNNTPPSNSSLINPNDLQLKKSWTKKLKHSFLGQKIKASRAYLKSLFINFGCIDEFKYLKEPQKKTFDDSITKQKRAAGDNFIHYSQRTAKSLSSSFCSSNGGLCDLQLVERSICPNTEVESSVEGAIAYCKKSYQQLLYSGNTSGAVACGETASPNLCRI